MTTTARLLLFLAAPWVLVSCLGPSSQQKQAGVPQPGTFYSRQRPGYPPLPFNPFPDLPVTRQSDGSFVVQDQQADYRALEATWQLQALPPVPATPFLAGALSPFGVTNYGSALWLEIGASNDTAILTLHNTSAGRQYLVQGTQALASPVPSAPRLRALRSAAAVIPPSWTVETNLVGATGQNWTRTALAMNGRTNLFLRVSEARDYLVDTSASFSGLDYLETGGLVADTMGAVGPDHFVELLNCASRASGFPGIAVFDKSGNCLMQTNCGAFFALRAEGTNYPTKGQIVDARILYDHRGRAWVACGLDSPSSGSGHIILAVCTNQAPFFTNWSKYLIPVKRPDHSTDFPTLGLDDNGVYLSVLHLASVTNGGHTVVAIPKPDLYEGRCLRTNFDVPYAQLPAWTIQPAVSFDDVATNGRAWFVAKGPPRLNKVYQGGALCYRRLQWNGTSAGWADPHWMILSEPTPTYRDYYDLDGTNTARLPLPDSGISAPQAGGARRMDLPNTGSRLMTAVIRDGFLWTCQHVGVAGADGTYVDNDPLGTNVDRSAVQWLKLQIGSNRTSLTHYDHGRIRDTTPSGNPDWYYFPSLMVNSAGDMVAAFSGSSATKFIGAYYGWLPTNSQATVEPRLFQAGQDYFDYSRWGDYSATSLDPTDELSFWTVQEFAGPSDELLGPVWGTWIARIRLGP